MSTIGNLGDIVLLLCILAALIATVRMCAKDAIRRGKSPWLVALLVIGLFPVGLLAWLAFRPKIVKADGSSSPTHKPPGTTLPG